MNIKKQVTLEIVLCILILCFTVLTVVTAFLNGYLFYFTLAVTVAVTAFFVVRSARIRSRISKIITGTVSGVSSEQKSVLRTMGVPVLITDATGGVLWYNDAFKQSILSDADIFLEDIRFTIKDFNAVDTMHSDGKEYTIKNRHYMVYSGMTGSGNDVLYVTYFVDDTSKNRDAEEYRKTRPCVMVFYLDNFDEIETEMKGSDSAIILSDVNRVLENFINTTNGVLMRVTSKNYVAIIEEQHMESLIDDRFPILDAMRSVSTGAIPVTLSIGVGRGAKTLFENNLLARQALDMALGRGGDQAALKTRNGYVFYGGVSREIEKRNKVKARIIASALVELFHQSENVVVMGHKASDLDAIGSAIGIARAAKLSGCDVNIVINPKTTLAGLLYDRYLKDGDKDLFITPQEAPGYIDKNTLLVVVDCHTYAQLDDPQLLEKAMNVVVIDHHRRMVGYIEDVVLFYHEPYASSCSEMVAELLQHIETSNDMPTKLDAEAMLAGIMLDTKNYSVRTGVRTFDAASYLRRLGADPIVAKSFFSISIDEYRHKAELVSMAIEYHGCAVVVTDTLPDDMRVVIPQTADDLLNIEGIRASIVAVKSQDIYYVSARSLGVYNVQLIMEEMGGGGHQTMAGVQIAHVENTLIREMIYNAIDKYLEQNEQKN